MLNEIIITLGYFIIRVKFRKNYILKCFALSLSEQLSEEDEIFNFFSTFF